ncbi:hypothetical protein CEXT_727001 [Caerostris extrusa]|uniref:Uncharacterized protein n=1 Tax=Caerostris extrusa TaxID=172846 RepID=A0AAV4Y1K5_CAEEX|nr:hypothetical protein CEXT_727001 [Caerostris extrusa]
MSWVLGLLLETVANRAALESQKITALVNFSRCHCSWDRTVRIAAPSNALPRSTGAFIKSPKADCQITSLILEMGNIVSKFDKLSKIKLSMYPYLIINGGAIKQTQCCPSPRNLTEWFQIGKTSTNLSPDSFSLLEDSSLFPPFISGSFHQDWPLWREIMLGNHKSGEGKLGHSSHWTSPRAMKISGSSSPPNNPIRLMAYPLVRKRGWFVSL